MESLKVEICTTRFVIIGLNYGSLAESFKWTLDPAGALNGFFSIHSSIQDDKFMILDHQEALKRLTVCEKKHILFRADSGRWRRAGICWHEMFCIWPTPQKGNCLSPAVYRDLVRKIDL